MRKRTWFIAWLFLLGCANVLAVKDIPPITLGEATFFPTIEAHTDAPILRGNRVELLLNGHETFPVMLRDIRSAKSSVTFAQYLYEDGPIANDMAEAFADRCRAGVPAFILLDSHGASGTPSELVDLMKDVGCQVEWFRRIDAEGILFPWKLLRYNYRSHRRVLVVDGRIGFTGGYGISKDWMGDGRTAHHWRDTNARIEGPVVMFLQAAFAESWLEATGSAIGGDPYFPRLEARGDVPAQIVKSFANGGQLSKLHAVSAVDNSAKKSIVITNPYFIPDDVMIDALVKAAARGVNVTLLLPGKIDSQITYHSEPPPLRSAARRRGKDLRISGSAASRENDGGGRCMGNRGKHKFR